jgi:hypothetical protein
MCVRFKLNGVPKAFEEDLARGVEIPAADIMDHTPWPRPGISNPFRQLPDITRQIPSKIHKAARRIPMNEGFNRHKGAPMFEDRLS